MKYLLLALFMIGSPAQSQTPTFDQVLDQLRVQFEKIEDYQVSITVRLKMPGIRMPRKKMTLSFKQPDKVRLKSRGFAMVPRRGLAFSPDSLLGDLTSVSVADTTLNDARRLALRGSLPFGDEGDETFVRAVIIVDPERWVITGMTTRLRGDELFAMVTLYTEPVKGIFLPEETTLTFHGVEDMLGGRRGPPFRPGGRRSRKRDESVADSTGVSSVESGEVVIQFKKYKVNQGLSDSFFEEDKTVN